MLVRHGHDASDPGPGPGASQAGARPRRFAAAAAAAALCLGSWAAAAEPLEVCADPNNLPFSDRDEGGFENALAELVAGELDRDGVSYTWYPQRRGFIRNTLRAGECDVVMGVPAGYELAATTRPYYYSTYVFVRRADSDAPIRSMTDPRLRELRIGVHAVGDDYSSTPGAAALARHDLVDNLVGYSIYGDYSEPHPPARLIEAVAAGEVDVAIAWGPLAGYFAPRQDVALEVVPVSPRFDGPDLPFVFGIAMGVRRGDDALRAQLDELIHARAADIERLLEGYGVPLVSAADARASRPISQEEVHR